MPIPQFSALQNVIKRVFYNPKRSVFIFTEDKPSDRIFYNLLLKRIKDESFDIVKVEPIGSKSIVIEKSIEDKKPSVPSLYIVDGDIKLMLGQKLENHNLIALDRYCIENYLCCEDGIINYLHINLGEEKNKIKSDLTFFDFISKNGKLLLKLYYRYALSFEIESGKSFIHVQNLTKTVDGLMVVNKDLVDIEILATEMSIKNKLKQNGVRNFAKVMNERINVIKLSNPHSCETIIKVLSGKDMLLPLICNKIKNVDNGSRSLTQDQIKRILADKVDIKAFDSIKNKLKSLT